MFELKDIVYEIDDGEKKKRIINHVSFNFEPGSFVVITGQNGSGKSTLAQIMMGIRKPTSGKIFFNQEDVTDKDITERARLGIAFSFQQPVKLKGITVYELIDIAGGGGIDPKNVAKYLKMVGLEPEKYMGREVDGSLSGGELKRLEIASVLARQAKMLIFDEPEAGIDLWSFNNLTTIFKKIQKDDSKKTVVMISHQERILKIADQIVIIEAGKIKDYGSATEMLPKVIGE